MDDISQQGSRTIRIGTSQYSLILFADDRAAAGGAKFECDKDTVGRMRNRRDYLWDNFTAFLTRILSPIRYLFLR